MKSNTNSSMSEGQLDSCNVPRWHPSFRNEGLPPYVVIEKIESFIDELLFLHNILPGAEAFPNFDQFSAPSQTSVEKNHLEILDMSSNFAKRICTFIRVSINWVQGSAHGFSNLANLGKKDVSMCENDEDVLPSLDSTCWVNERFSDVGLIHVKVAAQDTPKNSFEGSNTSTINSSCDKPKLRVIRESNHKN